MNDFFTVDPYPLTWPENWPRTKRPAVSNFYGNTIGKARDAVLKELRLMGARSIVISSNLPLRKDGQLAAVRVALADPGVAVYFERDGAGQCIPCDKWSAVEDNLWAIAKTVAALRGIDRWGAKAMVDATLKGFMALPESTGGGSWWNVLGVAATASVDDIRRAFFAKAKDVHPDLTGERSAWDAIQEAYDAGIAARSLT